jgi:hypothetical protein
MANTINTNIFKMPAAATDPAAIFNAFADKYEAGRTVKLLAGAAVSAGRAVTLDSAGARHCEPSEKFVGVSAGSYSAGAEMFVYMDAGAVITVPGAVFNPGEAVFVGSAGTFTQSPSGYGSIGLALSANTFMMSYTAGVDAGNLDQVLSASGTIQLMQSDISSKVAQDDLQALVDAILQGHGLIT